MNGPDSGVFTGSPAFSELFPAVISIYCQRTRRLSNAFPYYMSAFLRSLAASKRLPVMYLKSLWHAVT